MTVYVSTTVHGDVADLNVHRLNRADVVLHVGQGSGRVALFLGDDDVYDKTATLACLARWAELVEALPDLDDGEA